ncbi:hypothetical protein BpHYR1_042344 [Brachionus plicatilis]|uniref:Uncharacterized protein n=1 Tax=Brachionus plicatilis TaxID=10195 RepID=A0A3M7SV63_BRAPC|nr:hypothetical protein BpHYR1_042344 [Brachionus plicatilis]
MTSVSVRRTVLNFISLFIIDSPFEKDRSFRCSFQDRHPTLIMTWFYKKPRIVNSFQNAGQQKNQKKLVDASNSYFKK